MSILNHSCGKSNAPFRRPHLLQIHPSAKTFDSIVLNRRVSKRQVEAEQNFELHNPSFTVVLKLNEYCPVPCKKPHQCEVCPSAALQKSTLKRHIDAVHEKLKPHQCEECSYASAHKRELQAHIEKHHQGIKRFKCDSCSYAAVSKSHILRHERDVHLKIKSFECSLCGMQFSRSNGLEEHISSMHSKTKSFKCNECTYAAYTKKTLRNHQKLHKLDTIACAECSNAFNDQSAYLAHLCLKKEIKEESS